MHSLLQDLRYGARMLAKASGFLDSTIPACCAIRW